MMPTGCLPVRARHVAALMLLSGMLMACGGGGGDGAPVPAGSQSTTDGSTPSPTETTAAPDLGTGGAASAPPPATLPASTAPAPAPAAPAPVPVPVPGMVVLHAGNACGLPGFRSDLLAQINQARQTARSCGTQRLPAVAPLDWNDRLFSASAKHAQDMAENNYFSHTSLDGRNLGQRVTAEGYNWRAVGENIAGGPPSVSAVMQGWLGSAGHCRNIMGPAFNEVAVSCVARSGSAYGRYWVMVLGSR